MRVILNILQIHKQSPKSVLQQRWSKKFRKYPRKTPVPESKACNFIKKETLAQLFSCKFCEIFKNTFSTEHLRWLLLQVVEDFCSTEMVLIGIKEIIKIIQKLYGSIRN